MWSPVSPSATGKTLRSLISWRRVSRCASAPWTATRKRTRLGSDTSATVAGPAADSARASAAGLDGLGDLAGLEAPRADIHATRGLADEDPDLLQVRIEAPLGGAHGVAAALTESGTAPAAVANLRHSAAQCSGGRSAWRSRGPASASALPGAGNSSRCGGSG